MLDFAEPAQGMVANVVTSHHPEEGKAVLMSLMVPLSIGYCSFLTQVPRSELDAGADMGHEPLGFTPGTFRGCWGSLLYMFHPFM